MAIKGTIAELKAIRAELWEREKKHAADPVVNAAIQETIKKIDAAIDEQVNALIKDAIKL